MTESNPLDRFENWLRSFFSREGLAKNRLPIEGLVSVLWLLITTPAAAMTGGALGVFANAALAATIVLYRIQPAVSLVLAAFATLGLLMAGVPSLSTLAIFLPLLVVFFGCAAHGREPTRWLALPATFIAPLTIVATGYFQVFQNIQGPIFFLFVFATCLLSWVVGTLVRVNRSRRRAETGEIRATVKLGEVTQVASLEQERNRVARDVHDIVAHSLAVVIAQADGARYGAKNVPAPVVEALENIASTARGALTDVRVLLGELRHNQEQGPQPGMNDLDALVRGFRDSGLEVEWNSYGKAVELTDAPALAVYRIVQEGLTNALRHGDRGQPVELVFDWGSTSLAVIVTNGIPRGTTVPANAAGHGIPGMRERATLAGGELEASDGTNGRFRVRATIPFTREPVSA